jgi:transposase
MNVNLDSVAPIGSALRSIDSLVDELDTSDLEKGYDFKTSQGNTPIHPKTLIKVALWAMHNCRFSLRKMEDDTVNNLGYKWLTGGMTIDHSTIGKFLASNPVDLAELLTQVVQIGVEENLVDFDLLGLDTVKIRANASYKQFRDKAGIRKEKKKIKAKIEKILRDAAKDKDSSAELETLKFRHKRLEAARMKLAEREKDRKIKGLRINVTDSDCQMVKQGNGERNSGYPVTVAVDSKKDFITGVKMDEYGNDSRNLFPALEESEANCGQKHGKIVADPGFGSIENLEKLKKEGRDALIPDRRMEAEKQGEVAKGEYDRSKFKYLKSTDRYRCPKGKLLENADTVELNGRRYHKYTNREACLSCPCVGKCTKSQFRTISRDAKEELREEMRKKLDRQKETYKKRAHMTESPFGQMKHNLKFRIFMRRGLEKARMEVSMLCILHNLLKIAVPRFGYMTG